VNTKKTTEQEIVRIVIVGHVDHGKSTLIGRLLYDTNSLPENKLKELKKASERRGKDLEFAYLTDALEEEQEQNVTIDTVQLLFKTKKRDYLIIDAPGHKEFLKNMVTGAASAETAILMIDAEEGVKEQTKRHAYLISLLGLNNIIVVINKMDKVGYKKERFKNIEENIRVFLNRLNIKPSILIPISAKEGDNVTQPSENFPWYNGATVLEALDLINRDSKSTNQLRIPVQDIYKWDDKRIIAGRVESGEVCVGDSIVFSPSLKQSKVKTIEKWGEQIQKASEGECIGVTITNPLFIERGEIISMKGSSPATTNELEANIFWLGRNPFEKGKKYKLKLTTCETDCELASIKKRIDSSTLNILEQDSTQIAETEVGEVTLRTVDTISVDKFNISPKTGRFVIVDGYDVCGGGIVINHITSPNNIDS